MKRTDFIKSILALPFIGSVISKENHTRVVLSDVKQGGVATWGNNPQEGSLFYGENKGLYIFKNNKYQLMETRAWVDIKENCEQKLTLSDRRA